MTTPLNNSSINLDDTATYLPLDPIGISTMTADFAAQCQEAIAIGERVDIDQAFGDVDNIVVCGLGGSAIAGDLVDQLTIDRIKIPFHVNRRYTLPSWVDERSLVILSSYSGNTEETISSFQQALNRGSKCVCITSGGRVAQLADEHNAPVVQIPGGRPPRASTGYLIFPLISLLEKVGLIPSLEKERTEAVAIIEKMSESLGLESLTQDNEAKQLAQKLFGKFALIYGWNYLSPVAFRWQTQLNENSKMLAHAGVLPEMNHNEVVAWAHKSPIGKDLIAVLLRSKHEPPRLRARLDLTKRIITDHADALEVWTTGNSLLAQQMSLLYLGDFVSVYLALLGQKDPAEINAINFLKGELLKLSD